MMRARKSFLSAGPPRGIALVTGTAILVAAANASQGAYFSQSWGWVALSVLVPTSLVLILGRARVPGPGRASFLLLVSGLAAWTLMSVSWSISQSGTVREFERLVVYVSVAFAIAMILRRGDEAPVLGGIVVGTSAVSVYAVATRLLPDHFPTHDALYFGNRLGQPLGYPNALGLLCAVGFLLALAFVSHGGRYAAVGASLALPVQAAALYFTFSRGPWAALAVAFVIALVLDPYWLRSLWMSCVAATPSLGVVLLASRQDALTTSDLDLPRAAQEGQRLAVVLCVFTVCSGAVTWVAHSLAQRMKLSAVGRRIASVAVLASLAVAGSAALFAAGGPADGASRVRKSFETLPVGGTTDLNSRLFQIYGTGRAEIWPVTWDQFRGAKVAGTGAGSFEYVWYESRPTTRILRDAHSLYLETLAELGIVGCAILVLAILLPVIAGVRARCSHLVPFATAALLCWALASAFDWHWEMVGITIAAILAGSAGLLARAPDAAPTLKGLPWALSLAAATALSIFAVVSLVGNQALFSAKSHVTGRNWAVAQDDALHARKLLPWSVEPDLALGDARAGLGDRDGALIAYRDAVDKDPRNWTAWLRVAQLARGDERRRAYARVHELNPRQENLPGERRSFR